MNIFQLKEEDRLAATVGFINQEAVVIPRGVLLKEPDGYVVVNKAFEGASKLYLQLFKKKP